MRLKASKCKFLQTEVQHLGHRITNEGVFPTEEKAKAVQDAPAPKNVQQLQSFLGSINYYEKFLPNLSNRLAPLHGLLTKGKRWTWTKEHQKRYISRCQGPADFFQGFAIHFDSSKEVLLSCDASPYGVGAVLSHCFEDGTEHPWHLHQGLSHWQRKITPNWTRRDWQLFLVLKSFTTTCKVRNSPLLPTTSHSSISLEKTSPYLQWCPQGCSTGH